MKIFQAQAFKYENALILQNLKDKHTYIYKALECLVENAQFDCLVEKSNRMLNIMISIIKEKQ